MDFLAQTDNLVLAALIIISGTALFMPTLSTLISGKGLTPTDATIWINRRKASVIDLRAEEDFKLGHLPNAKNIPDQRYKEQSNCSYWYWGELIFLFNG
ncbi:MAG: rhodanese-like domain-containing protein [Burkholderiaceae bacterium]|nr:rhodanese-like domain-containing protein [Burkholderiaceae bacterium]